MSKQNNNTPRLRFPGFTGEWVEKKLGESVGSFKTGKLDANAMVEGGEYRFYTCAKDFSFIDSYAFEGDCIMIAGNGAHLGYVHHYNGKFNAYQRTYVLSDFNCDSNYLECCIRRFLPDRIRQEKKEGNMPYIVLSTLTDMLLYFPPSPEEQKKIADCLFEMDNLISAQAQKVEALKDQKKGMMQQLFPQKGETTPRLRFPGFTEEWKERKFSDCFEIGSGRDYKHLQQGEIPVYGSGGYMCSVNDYLYDGDSACIGRKGTINKPIFISGKFWTVDTLFYTYNYVETSAYFIYLLFQNIDWMKHNEAGGVPSLSKNIIKKIKVFIPSLTEQQKISDCLSALDAQIAAETEKLTALKDHKKGLMQQLFPQPAK